MDTSDRRLEILQKAVNIVGVSFAVVLNLNIRWALNIHWILILLSVSMIFMLLLFIDYNKKSIIPYITILSVIICGFIILTINKGNIYHYGKKLRSWFLDYQITKENYQITYALTIIFLCIVFVSFLFYFIHKNKILRYAISLSFMVWFVYCIMDEIVINKVTLGILLIYIIQALVELCNNIYYKKIRIIYNNKRINIFKINKNKKCYDYNKSNFHNINNNNREENNYITNFYLMPLCILIGVLAVSMPSSSKPIQWRFVKQFADAISEKCGDIAYQIDIITGKYSDEFGINFAGYSDDGDGFLGGVVNESNQVILTVRPRTKAYNCTYLIGSVRDTYTSTGWKKSEIDYNTEEEPIMDFYQTIYGMYQKKIIPKGNEMLFHEMSLYVNYDKIKTKTIFYPLKTYDISIPYSKISYESSSPTLHANKVLKKDFSYEVNYYEVNYKSETIKNYLRTISKTNEGNQSYNRDDCINYLRELLDIDYFNEKLLNEDFVSLLKKRTKIINEYYTKVPERLPNRVRELAEQITKDYDNNYDKLMAIKSYLASFRYTLTPTKTKEGEDFVDYFLFEQKEGYCTYFATAMAILARCINIPTRYVEGVVVDYSDKKDSDYLVNSNSAHAWIDAYIEGVGWIPFDPTPESFGENYNEWEEKIVIKNNNSKAIAPEISQQKVTGQQEQNLALSQEKSKRAKYMGYFCIVIIIIICILFCGVIMALSHNRKKKYHNATREDKLRFLMHDMMDDLAEEGYVIMLGETLVDYAERISDTYIFDGISLEEICSIYMRLRYSNMAIEDIEMKKITRYRDQLKNYVRKKMSWNRRIKYQLTLLLRLYSA